MTEEQKIIFWSKVDKTASCWNWTGYLFSTGYGGFRVNGKMKKAHRIAYILTHSSINESLDVMHICDNPKCVNPFHLKQGSRKENQIDMAKKNRCGRQKLSVADIAEIRSLPLGFNQSECARKYGVSAGHISKVISRNTWKHV